MWFTDSVLSTTKKQKRKIAQLLILDTEAFALSKVYPKISPNLLINGKRDRIYDITSLQRRVR